MFSLYLVFCLTTAIMANYKIFSNVLDRLSADDILNKNRVLSRITFFVLSVLAAPVLFFVVLVPSIEKTFTDAMTESMTDKK
jgi:hypothetical protein